MTATIMRFSSAVLLFSLLAVLPTIQVTDGVEYAVTNRAEGTNGGQLFRDQIGTDSAKHIMRLAVTNIQFWIFQQKDQYSERKDVKRVRLIIDKMHDAIAGAGAVSSTHKVVKGEKHEIHLSAGDIERWSRGSVLLKEFYKVIHYEMAHVFQWTANGDAPVGLANGIATYAVQFIFGRPESRSNVRRTDGWSWNKSPEVISQFLFFCDEEMSGFVAELNKKMKDFYSDKYFEDLLHKRTEVLWEEYKVKYGEKE